MFWMTSVINNQEDITVEVPEELISSINELKTLVENVNVNVTSEKYTVSKTEYEDNAAEDKALELAIESIESRDFKRAVFDSLINYGVDIDSYKDITEIKVLDTDVDDDEVEFDVKVFYFIEDDKSEEYKSRLYDFIIVVDDLDFDDDFEDAEVDESYMDDLEIRYAREI